LELNRHESLESSIFNTIHSQWNVYLKHSKELIFLVSPTEWRSEVQRTHRKVRIADFARCYRSPTSLGSHLWSSVTVIRVRGVHEW